MVFILVPPLAFAVYKYGKHLHKNEYKYYLGATIIGVIGVVLTVLAQANILITAETLRTPFIYELFFQGHLPLALFILVMFAGAFKNKSKPKIALMRVRRELAILGFLFLLPHAAFLIIPALTALNPTGTLALLIMIPLFITSFPKIRKKMHPLEWRKLHKWAYAAYAMIYLHLASITLIAQEDSLRFVRFGLYTVIFAFYSYLKFKNYIIPKKKAKKTTPKQDTTKSSPQSKKQDM